MKRDLFVVSRALAFIGLGGLAAIIGVKLLPSQPSQPALSVLPVALNFGNTGSTLAAAADPKGASPLAPIGSGFTYQGRLTNGGNPASGPYDFVFTLFDAASAGNQISSP